MMIIPGEKTILKNGDVIELRSPSPGEAHLMLRHLQTVFSESGDLLNPRDSQWRNFPLADEEWVLKDFARAPRKFMLSAFAEDGSIVGNLGFFAGDGKNRLSAGRIGMGVNRSHWGRGLGYAMMSVAIREAGRMNLRKVHLNVHRGNAAAIALYRKCGFVPVGRDGTQEIHELSLPPKTRGSR